MKTRPILLAAIAGALGIAALGAFTTPLNRAFLQSNLNGNGYAGTNFGTIRSTNFIDAATGLPLSFGGSSTNFGVVAGTGLTGSTQSSAGLKIVTLADTYAKQPAHASLTNVTTLASNNYVGTFTGNVAGATNLPFGALSADAATAVTNAALVPAQNATNKLSADVATSLNSASNVLRLAQIASTNILNTRVTSDLNSASNVLRLAQASGLDPRFVSSAGTITAGSNTFAATALRSGTMETTNNATIGGALNVTGNVFIDGDITGNGAGLVEVPTNALDATAYSFLTSRASTSFVVGRSTNFTAYAAGTAYSLTATPAALDFGTTDPAMTLLEAGTYLIRSRVGVKFNGSTYGTTQTATLKLRRTNNTAADLSNGSRAVTMPILTTFTGGSVFDLPEIVYTATAGDQITVFGSMSATPSAGSVDTDSAEIVAQRIY